MFLDVGYVTLNKKGEELCGDKVEFVRNQNGITVVLADGLGSGVKANILATLTSSMLCNMISNGLDITDAVSTVIRTLPVCKVRRVAYSTFSIIYLNNEGEGKLIECDNPQAIILREGKLLNLNREELAIDNKVVYVTDLKLKYDDVVVINSDGVIHAGIGSILNFGWERGDVISYFESRYLKRMSARCLASVVAGACYDLYLGSCGDDTTVACVKATKKQTVSLMVGPPAKKEFDEKVCESFMSQEGKHIVCGGTTSQVVAKYLNEEVSTDLTSYTLDMPPIGYIKGIDLVTEGVLTVRKLIEISDKYLNVKDSDRKEFIDHNGASMLGNLLFEEANKVIFYVGRGVNIAHSELDIANSMKLHLVEELARRLERLGKSVELKYC